MSNSLVIELRKQIADLFEDPLMLKINEIGNTGIYKTRVESMLSMSQQKYIVAIVKNDNYPLFEQRRLSKIKWNSFQARQVPKNVEESLDNLPICLVPQNKKAQIILKDKIIKMTDVDDQVTYASSTLPINIVLIVEDRSKYPTFQNTSTLEKSIMYFNTVITV